jgi:hypothetical protein
MRMINKMISKPYQIMAITVPSQNMNILLWCFLYMLFVYLVAILMTALLLS